MGYGFCCVLGGEAAAGVDCVVSVFADDVGFAHDADAGELLEFGGVGEAGEVIVGVLGKAVDGVDVVDGEFEAAAGVEE